MKEYFADPALSGKVKESGGYTRTQEKAHGQIETKEYYQTEDIGRLGKGMEWEGLGSIGMEKKTIEYLYYINSLRTDRCRKR